MALSRCGWCGVALRPASRAAHVRAAGCHDCGHSTVVGDDGVAVAFPRTAPRVQQVDHRVRFSPRLRGGGVAADALASVLRAAVEGPGAAPAPTPAGAVRA